MPTPTSTSRMCPLLGLAADPSSAHLYASDQHRCYATVQGQPISLSHQERFCLSRSYPHCPIYLAAKPRLAERERQLQKSPEATAMPAALESSSEQAYERGVHAPHLNRAVVVVAIATLLFVLGYFAIVLLNRPSPSGNDNNAAALLATRTATPTRVATQTATARPSLAGTPIATEAPKPSPPPGGQLISLNPSLNAAGWVASNERIGNHFDDSVIQVGVYDRVIYYGILQFDVAAIPPGTKLAFALLEMTGLNDERLGPGTWQVKTVRLPVTKQLSAMNFEDVRLLQWDQLLQPTLTREQLSKGRVNRFDLTGPLLTAIEQQFGQGKITFRIEGPTGSANSLFMWDVGLGSDGLGSRPILHLGIQSGPVEQPVNMVVIPCVPTPATEAERVARAATATYAATVFGTPTPYPTNYVTPIIVTPMTTEQAIFAAATQIALGTPQGVPTATPPNWVSPIIVTNTPTPMNEATAVYQRAVATALAATTGTPTPMPCYVWTATPTPPAPTATNTPVVLYPTGSATPTITRTPTPTAIPSILNGKIVFWSDRDGGEPAPYVMDPDGRRVGKLTNRWAYDAAYLRQQQASGGYQVSVTGNKTVGTKIVVSGPDLPTPKVIFENSAINYDPVFAPNGYDIAFVSTATGADELYRTNRDGRGVTQLTTGSSWEWNKHPSWSPDGGKIVWWSNRETGRKQIWIMDADGKNMRNLSNNEFNDWDPVWVR